MGGWGAGAEEGVGVVSESAPFTLLIQRRPPSGAKGPNRQFAEHVTAEARRRWGTTPALRGDLYARVTWFHAERRTQDVDNIPKRVLDTLNGIVYEDDKMVAQTLATAIDVTRDYTIGAPIADDDLFQRMLLALESMTQSGDSAVRHLIYIEVGVLERQHVVFGEIDRRTP